MTEKAFWEFIRMAIAKGRMDQVSGYIDSDDQDIHENGRYVGGHSVLFEGYDRLPKERMDQIGGLLFDPSVSKQAKEAVLMLLAHYPKRCALNILRKYNSNPDKDLAYYAKTALWECQMWNK